MRIGPRPSQLAVVISLFVLAMGCATTSGLPEVQRVVVPDVVGRPLGEARQILVSRNLAFKIVDEQSSDRPVKTVLKQTPVAGTLVETGPGMPFVVNVVIAAPGATARAVLVPRLSGRTIKEVEEQLVPQGLRLGQVTFQASGEVQPGTVIVQHPRAGERVEPGTAVNVVIATSAAVEPQPVLVPRLSGRTLQEVKSLLARSGLRVGQVTFQASGEVQPGTVIEQRPRAGERVERNVVVNLVVVKAPPPEPAAIAAPAVIGEDEKEAAAILARFGLGVGKVTSQVSDRPAGTIIDQNPKPGARIQSGTAVDVVIATSGAAPPVPLPVGSPDQGTTLTALKWKLLAVGLGLIVLILVIAVLIPHPTSFQYLVFRTTLALAAACVASALPGFFEFKRELPQAGIAAGGALAVFVLVYMLDPGKMMGKTDGNSQPKG